MDSRGWLIVLEGSGLTIFIFGLLAWSYSVAIQIAHPEWLGATLTHHTFPPFNWRVDDVGIIGFAAAALGFFMWILGRRYLSTSRRGSS